MPTLTPRQNEVAAVVAVLESEDYDTAADMAKAVIRALGPELSKRDFYVMAWSLPGEDGGVNYGPFATLAELQRHAKQMPAGQHTAALVLGPDRPRAGDDSAVSGECSCNHAPEQHVVRNVRGGKTSKPAECGVYKNRRTKCECSSYQPKGKQ